MPRPADQRGRSTRRRRQGPAGAGRRGAQPAPGTSRSRPLPGVVAPRCVLAGAGGDAPDVRRATDGPRPGEQLGRGPRSPADHSSPTPRSRAAHVVGPPHRRPALRCCATTEARLFGLDGLPGDVRAEARSDYIDSVRSDLEISSNDQLTGELNIAWVHLGVEGNAGIVEQADGTFRVDLLDGRSAPTSAARAPRATPGSGRRRPELRVRLPGRRRGVRRRVVREADADVDLSVFAGPAG